MTKRVTYSWDEALALPPEEQRALRAVLVDMDMPSPWITQDQLMLAFGLTRHQSRWIIGRHVFEWLGGSLFVDRPSIPQHTLPEGPCWTVRLKKTGRYLDRYRGGIDGGETRTDLRTPEGEYDMSLTPDEAQHLADNEEFEVPGASI